MDALAELSDDDDSDDDGSASPSSGSGDDEAVATAAAAAAAKKAKVAAVTVDDLQRAGYEAADEKHSLLFIKPPAEAQTDWTWCAAFAPPQRVFSPPSSSAPAGRPKCTPTAHLCTPTTTNTQTQQTGRTARPPRPGRRRRRATR